MSGTPPYAAKLKAPFAVLGIRTADGKVTGIEYLPTTERAQAPSDSVAAQTVRELERYFADPHHRFTLPLVPRGTDFQRRVWDAIAAIPVGESRTYGEIARNTLPMFGLIIVAVLAIWFFPALVTYLPHQMKLG